MSRPVQRGGFGLSANGAGLWGALLLALAVGIGAFGTHTLSTILAPARLETLDTAVRYQFIGGLGLLLLAALARDRGPSVARLLSLGSGLLLTGTAIFCVTLYGLVAGGPSWLGAITPLGGAAQIVAWVAVASAFATERQPASS